MARGKQKEQAREKAQKLAEARSGGKSQLEARAKGLQLKCPVCKTPAANYKVVVQHMEAKHPKEAIPPETAFQTHCEKQDYTVCYVRLLNSTGTKDPSTGVSWCPDCVRADPLIHRCARPDSVLVEVPVGTRSEYKGRPDNPYKTHPRIQLKAIPTLIKWSVTGSDDDKRLVEYECANEDALSELFSE
ncbi:4362_t:CDS:2 [Acaulospora colombiana]|uniref:4362_t:CDS:1 n=1 Tax=Acaulospora colombiana TaxID=27376 RepID=A0ACA9KLV9_9GLOM|nr:4362_t:CDS:2 [Acaulospora colombiana]